MNMIDNDNFPAAPDSVDIDSVFEVLGDSSIVALDLNGHVTSWSVSAERLMAYGQLEVLGQPVARFFSPDNILPDLADHMLDTAHEQGQATAECWWLRKDGERFRVRLILRLQRGREGKPLGFALIVRDVNRIAKVEQELFDAREALQVAQKLEVLAQLTSGVAHDFNNMMMVLRSRAARLTNETLTQDERTHCQESMIATIDAASALVARLMSFAHQQPLRLEEFDVTERLLAIRTLLETTLGDAVTLKMVLSPELISVNTDRHQFEAAIINLVVNARDAIVSHKGRGRVTINAARVNGIAPIRSHPQVSGSFAAISVADTGPGIPEDSISKIFAPFFTTKTDEGGSGLGLAQVKSFAERSGGQFDVTSTPGEGSTFTLYLPSEKRRIVTALNVVTAPPSIADGPELEGFVLLVEDNPRVAESTVMLLEDMGLDTLWARDAEDALAKLHERKGGFDLVVTDIVMPRMSGIALARVIATRWPSLPVVLISGYSDELTTGHGGDLDLIQKPFTRATLLATLTRYLPPRGGGER